MHMHFSGESASWLITSDSPGRQHTKKSIGQILSEVYRDCSTPVFYKFYCAQAVVDSVGEKVSAFYLLPTLRHVRETWSVFIVDDGFSVL